MQSVEVAKKNKNKIEKCTNVEQVESIKNELSDAKDVQQEELEKVKEVMEKVKEEVKAEKIEEPVKEKVVEKEPVKEPDKKFDLNSIKITIDESYTQPMESENDRKMKLAKAIITVDVIEEGKGKIDTFKHNMTFDYCGSPENSLDRAQYALFSSLRKMRDKHSKAYQDRMHRSYNEIYEVLGEQLKGIDKKVKNQQLEKLKQPKKVINRVNSKEDLLRTSKLTKNGKLLQKNNEYGNKPSFKLKNVKITLQPKLQYLSVEIPYVDFNGKEHKGNKLIPYQDIGIDNLYKDNGVSTILDRLKFELSRMSNEDIDKVRTAIKRIMFNKSGDVLFSLKTM